MCRAERLAFILTGAAGTTYRIPQTSLDAHLDQTAAPAPTLVPHLDGQIALVG
jgi:hypothetical protein